MALLKAISQEASLAITSARIRVPDVLLRLGRDAILTALLNSCKPVLEGVHVAWRSTSPFDSAFAWNACHSYANSSIRMIFVYSIRTIFVCSLAKTFGHLSDRAKKTVIDRVLIREHYIYNKVFVSHEGINAFLLRTNCTAV